MSLRPYKIKPNRSSRTHREHRRSRRHASRGDEDSASTYSERSARSARLSLALPIVFLVGVMIPADLTSYVTGRGLRRLMHKCVKNIYALTPQMAMEIPPLEADTKAPSYITMCKDLLNEEDDGGVNMEDASHLTESDAACTDWTAPHYRLMNIFASSILDRVSGRTSYRHDCYDSRTFDEAMLGMDRTTIQQMIPVSRFNLDEIEITKEELKEQCKVCLSAYDAETEKTRFKPYAHHQCLAWPQSMEGHQLDYTSEYGLGGERVKLPESAVAHNLVPISAIADQIRTRLGYVADVASNTTDAPPGESEDGVVIYLDPSSAGIAKQIYAKYFPPSVSSITVLSSPLCATAILPTGQACMTYAHEMVEYFKKEESFNHMNTTGWKGAHGIRFQMAASSAGTFSRMIRSKRLVCPPNTPSCLLPAMSKKQNEEAITHAFVLDDDNNAAANFFSMVGHGNRVIVERLEATDLPPAVEKPDIYQLYDSNGDRVAQEFMDAAMDYDAEGYAPGKAPQPLPTRAQVAEEASKKREIPVMFGSKDHVELPHESAKEATNLPPVLSKDHDEPMPLKAAAEEPVQAAPVLFKDHDEQVQPLKTEVDPALIPSILAQEPVEAVRQEPFQQQEPVQQQGQEILTTVNTERRAAATNEMGPDDQRRIIEGEAERRRAQEIAQALQ